MTQYPEYANVDGVRYKIATDFTDALRAMAVVNDTWIGDHERALAIIYILFGIVPEDEILAMKLLEKARIFLQCGEDLKPNGEQRPDMDIVADQKYINASFLSDYGIDLHHVNMHWWQYCELIAGLTGECVLSRVREIRNYDMTGLKGKARDEMMKAKRAVALPTKYTSEEQEAIDEFEKLFERSESDG